MRCILPSTVATILLSFQGCFTAPTFFTFQFVMVGWVLAQDRRVTSMILAADGLRWRSFSTFHRFFNQARWSMDQLFRTAFLLALELMPKDVVILLAVDDTLTHSFGKHVWGAGMHHDAVRSTGGLTAFSFGHNWVVISVIVSLPFMRGRLLALPVGCRLYRRKAKPGRPPKNANKRHTGAAPPREYRTRPELAVELLQLVVSWAPDRKFMLVGDSAYGGKSVSRHLPENAHLTSRMPMNAALYAVPPVRRKGEKGRTRKKGERLPSPKEMSRRHKAAWRSRRVVIYGRKVKVHYQQVKGLWYSSAGSRLLNIVVVRDPLGHRKDDCFFTTDLHAKPLEILQIVAGRWNLEVTFRNCKQELGIEDPQNRVRPAVERTATFGFLAYTLVVVWFARGGEFKLEEYRARRPWYRTKEAPSFTDMLDELRREILAHRVSATAQGKKGRRKNVA